MVGIPLTTVAYLLANVGYFAVMSKEEVLLSHAVAVVSNVSMSLLPQCLMSQFISVLTKVKALA